MNVYVIHEANFVCEGLPAQFAGERALSSVTYVGVKSCFICETLSALSARVRLLSSVESHVDFKTFFSVKLLPHC